MVFPLQGHDAHVKPASANAHAAYCGSVMRISSLYACACGLANAIIGTVSRLLQQPARPSSHDGMATGHFHGMTVVP